jgi:enamine deaminase RidA (YjgF/YER057c/UK114 family)
MNSPVLPDGWPRPSGFSEGILSQGQRIVWVTGQIGHDGSGPPGTLASQSRFALGRIAGIVRAAGGDVSDITKVGIFVRSIADYRASAAEVGREFRAVLGRHYPATTLVETSGLMVVTALVEIEAMAVF